MRNFTFILYISFSIFFCCHAIGQEIYFPNGKTALWSDGVVTYSNEKTAVWGDGIITYPNGKTAVWGDGIISYPDEKTAVWGDGVVTYPDGKTAVWADGVVTYPDGKTMGKVNRPFEVLNNTYAINEVNIKMTVVLLNDYEKPTTTISWCENNIAVTIKSCIRENKNQLEVKIEMVLESGTRTLLKEFQLE